MPELKFNPKIYKRKAVKEAIAAFSHLAEFKLNDRGYIRVKIEHIDRRFKDVLTDEFSNYVLGLTKKCLCA